MKQMKRWMRRLEDGEKGVATSGKRRKMKGKRNLVLNLLYVPMLPRRLRVEHWEAPFGEMLKINGDVAWIARKRMATHEAVVRDSKGMICAGCTQYLEGAFGTLSTKTIVIIGVLQIARDLDLHHIEVELGCLAIVNKLNCNSQANVNVVEEDYRFYVVGKGLMDSVLNFPSLQNTPAYLWHPLGGVTISYIGDKRILFRFYYEVDLKRLCEVPFIYSIFCVHIHNLPLGFMSKGMARQFGNFLKYDASLIARGVNRYMRIQYDKLTLFCFLCGKLGHREGFCSIWVTLGTQVVEFGWDISLRAAPRRESSVVNKWLKEENLGRQCRWEGSI
ncbi:hypothetical protein Gohar_008973, partial [Gossypium harknessii]|nr:hypothetical protein [Gossypium harknessii]